MFNAFRSADDMAAALIDAAAHFNATEIVTLIEVFCLDDADARAVMDAWCESDGDATCVIADDVVSYFSEGDLIAEICTAAACLTHLPSCLPERIFPHATQVEHRPPTRRKSRGNLMTTLADMTPEKRAKCVGMWCNIGPHEPGISAGSYLFVLRSSGNYRGAMHAKLLDPISGVSEYISFKNITLRFDLPRAWNPDGTPPDGEWQSGGQGVGMDRIHRMKYGEPTHRRWVNDWEPLP